MGTTATNEAAIRQLKITEFIRENRPLFWYIKEDSLENTKAILITQNIKDAPFDIADLNHITYSPDNLRDLREKLQKAILALEKDEEEGDDSLDT